MSSRTSAKMREIVCLELAALDAVPVENGDTCPGHPDVDYAGGSMELKSVARYPAKDHSPIPFKSFTDDQRVWLVRRKAAGEPTFVLARVSGDWYLVDGDVAARRLGLAGKIELRRIATRWWPGGRMDWSEMIRVLRQAKAMKDSI